MKATIKKYVLRTCKGANGSFQVLDIFVDVVNDKNEVRTYRGQMGAEYAKKYFAYCGVTTKATIGQPCEISLVKEQYTTKDGEQRQVTKIKYFNLLDENNKPIIMYKNKVDELDF